MAKDLFGHNRATNATEGWNVGESKTIVNPAKNSRVDLDPFAFDRLIKQQGTRLKIHRTLYCPNSKSTDGSEHNIDCTLCSGSGWLDVDPKEIVGILQSQSFKKLVRVEGLIDGNLIQVTLPLGIEMTYFTLIELLDFTDIYIQRVSRNDSSDVDVLKYSACRVNALISRSGVRYYQDVDFTLDPNGDILWLVAGNKPADQEPYSIHYEAAVQFRAVRALHVNRFARHNLKNGDIEHLKFPETWVIAKEYMLKRRDVDGNELTQGPYDFHAITP